MKALSVYEPWASLVVDGIKPVENRNWRYSPKYRGPLLIHAAKHFDYEGWQWIQKAMNMILPDPGSYKRGGIIGRVDFTRVVLTHDSPWFFGPLGFVFENPVSLPFTPYRGRQGLFEVPDYGGKL